MTGQSNIGLYIDRLSKQVHVEIYQGGCAWTVLIDGYREYTNEELVIALKEAVDKEIKLRIKTGG